MMSRSQVAAYPKENGDGGDRRLSKHAAADSISKGHGTSGSAKIIPRSARRIAIVLHVVSFNRRQIFVKRGCCLQRSRPMTEEPRTINRSMLRLVVATEVFRGHAISSPFSR